MNPAAPPDPVCHATLLQAGLDLLDQGVTLFDAGGRLLACNRPARRLLELPDELARPGTAFETFVRRLAAAGESGAGDVEAEIAGQLAAAAAGTPAQSERRRPSGRILLARGEPLPDGGYALLHSDVTEQRYLENLSEYQNIQLEERVRRRTAQLENANANLRRAGEENERMQAALMQAQKMEAIGQLTGGLAHDFNNLLTVIIGNLAALQDQRPGDELVDEFVAPALNSARRGVQLIRRLLTFSRQQPLAPQAVDIGRLVNGLTTLIRRSLPESIAVSTDLAGATLHALADPGQLESALLNFALNARDAMPDGGSLHIAARPVELAGDAAGFDVPPGRYALIEVADNGCGMDAATLARACEPFFTTKRLGLGSGLGLAMVYGFVRQSGGGIAIHSEPGRGTTVLMVLPLTGPPGDAEPAAEGAPPVRGSELVLLVEDDPDVRRVVRQQLIDLGHPVIEAEDGSRALSMVEQIPDIAIVVSDLIMPGGLNGRQLADRLAREHPDMRVVLISGYADEATTGASDRPVLGKPFAREDLARALQHSARGKP